MREERRSRHGTQTVHRVALLLRTVASMGSQGTRLIDLARQTNLERPTVHRLLKGLMKELSSFSMLVVEDGSTAMDLKEDLSTTVADFTGRNEFQDLFRLQSGGEDMFIRIQEKEGWVREAVLMMDSDDGFVVIDLRGNIDIKYFTRLVEGGYLNKLTELSALDR